MTMYQKLNNTYVLWTCRLYSLTLQTPFDVNVFLMLGVLQNLKHLSIFTNYKNIFQYRSVDWGM